MQVEKISWFHHDNSGAECGEEQVPVLLVYLVDYGWVGLAGWTEVGWMDDGWTVIGRQTKLMDDWHWEVWITDK